MNYLKYAIFGLLQGITEPIPVSSSGHLRVFRELFNTDMFNDLNFEIFVNFGSFLAILFIFRKDIIKLIKGFFNYIFNKDKKIKNNSKLDFNYCILVIIGTIPAGIIGFILKDFIENKLGNINIVGISFLITAVSLLVISNIKGTKEDKDITKKDALLVGLMQAIAVMPGISRSGATLVGCMLRDFKRETALKFSFILYFPISIATMLLGVLDIVKDNQLSEVLLPYSFGMIIAMIATYFSTKWLFEVVKKGKLWKFAIYCFLLGLFTLFIL